MDVRRFVTVTKSELVKFFSTKLNGTEFASLWNNVGKGVDVSVARPGWKVTDKLSKPLVILQKIGASSDFTAVSSGQYIAEGYWKEMTFQVHACTDDDTGGAITVDDLSSAIELVLAKYSASLQSVGVMVWGSEDSDERDEHARFENVTTVVTRVMVPGANIQPSHIEMGRLAVTSPSFGHFYAGTDLLDGQQIQVELVESTSGTDAVLEVIAEIEDGGLATLTAQIPRATAKGTVIDLSGGDPADVYTGVANMTVTGGQAGYAFAVYNKIGG